MRTLAIVGVHPVVDDALGGEAVSDVLQIDRFIFERPPETFDEDFDEDVVHASAPRVHADPNLRLGERGDPVRSDELAFLIRIHDLRRAVFADGLVQRVHTEVRMHDVRHQPPQHLARRPVHDRHQIKISSADGYEGDVCAPDLFGPRDLQALQEVREDRMGRMRLADLRPAIDCVQAHLAHEAAHTVASHLDPVPRQPGCDLAAAEERILR